MKRWAAVALVLGSALLLSSCARVTPETGCTVSTGAQVTALLVPFGSLYTRAVREQCLGTAAPVSR